MSEAHDKPDQTPPDAALPPTGDQGNDFDSELPTQTSHHRPELSGLDAPSESPQRLPEQIGPYRIETVIGQGGMGTVYKAMQESPRRTVALKVVKRGVTSRSALKRFEYEAQTLGRLRHEHIAQISEAGTHLKPGNILVTGTGVPKVIDFGVARSTDSDMAVTTLRTDLGQLIGTLQYMSPEQCEADPEDIDTRSDVYALGMVLYELLTGSPAYSVKDAAIHEAVRIIREEEPTRLSSVSRQLRGDIETMSLKALEKDRDRRYQSAVELSQDIERYLNDEPISARPPGAIDHLLRFVRKHKAATTAAAMIALVLAGAVIAILLFAIEANVERKRAEAFAERAGMEATRATAVKDFLTSMLNSVKPANAQTMDTELMKLVLAGAGDNADTDLSEQPLINAEVQQIIGNIYTTLGLYDDAVRHLESSHQLQSTHAGADDPDTTRYGIALGLALLRSGDVDAAEGHYLAALDLLESESGAPNANLFNLYNQISQLRSRQGRYTDAEVYIRKALEGRKLLLGEQHEHTLLVMNNLAVNLQYQRRLEEAETLHRAALEGRRATLGESHPDTIQSINNMGGVLYQLDRVDESETYFRQAMEQNRIVLGEEHNDTLKSMTNMAVLLGSRNAHDEAEQLMREVLVIQTRTLGEEHIDTLNTRGMLGQVLTKLGRHDEAAELLVLTFHDRRRILGEEHPHTVGSQVLLGKLRIEQQQHVKARDLLTGARNHYLQKHGPTHPRAQNVTADLIRLHQQWHDVEPDAGHDATATEYKVWLKAATGKDEKPETP
jgi:tetratricopeptide (TPR) repeat protein